MILNSDPLCSRKVSKTEKLLFSSAAASAGVVGQISGQPPSGAGAASESGVASGGNSISRLGLEQGASARLALQEGQSGQSADDDNGDGDDVSVMVSSMGAASSSNTAATKALVAMQTAVASVGTLGTVSANTAMGFKYPANLGNALHLLPAEALELPGSFLREHVFIEVISDASHTRSSCMLGDAPLPSFDCLAQIYRGNVDSPEAPVRAYVTPLGAPVGIAFGSSFEAIASNWTVWLELSDHDLRGDQADSFAYAVSKRLDCGPIPRSGTWDLDLNIIPSTISTKAR